MASMTIRNIPTLEQAICPGPIPVDQILDKANRFRAATRIKTTDGEIRRFKRVGWMSR